MMTRLVSSMVRLRAERQYNKSEYVRVKQTNHIIFNSLKIDEAVGADAHVASVVGSEWCFNHGVLAQLPEKFSQKVRTNLEYLVAGYIFLRQVVEIGRRNSAPVPCFYKPWLDRVVTWYGSSRRQQELSLHIPSTTGTHSMPEIMSSYASHQGT